MFAFRLLCRRRITVRSANNPTGIRTELYEEAAKLYSQQANDVLVEIGIPSSVRHDCGIGYIQNACRNRNYQLSGYETQARAEVCEYDRDSNKGHLIHKQTGHQLHQYEFEHKHVSLTDIVTMWFAFCES